MEVAPALHGPSSSFGHNSGIHPMGGRRSRSISPRAIRDSYRPYRDRSRSPRPSGDDYGRSAREREEDTRASPSRSHRPPIERSSGAHDSYGTRHSREKDSPRHRSRDRRGERYATASPQIETYARSPMLTPPGASPAHHDSIDGRERRHSSHRSRHHSRRRTESPASGSHSHRSHHHRDHSRHRHHHHHHHRHRRSSQLAVLNLDTSEGAVSLPYGARPLSYGDFDAFRPLFAHYLDLHKQLLLDDLDEREARGRWKSFVRRWNRGELAEGWYEPEMFLRVVRARTLDADEDRGPASRAHSHDAPGRADSPPTTGAAGANEAAVSRSAAAPSGPALDDEDESDWGPTLPGASRDDKGAPSGGTGPAFPSVEDLELRRTLEAEAAQERAAQLRMERKADRREQVERLEELVPRAPAGTRERQLEKRRAVADKMRAFQEGAGGRGELEEVGERDLMGGGDGAEDYRRQLESMQRKKTERELRREAFVRARNAEREERIREYKEREAETVQRLRELARQRFG